MLRLGGKSSTLITARVTGQIARYKFVDRKRVESRLRARRRGRQCHRPGSCTQLTAAAARYTQPQNFIEEHGRPVRAIPTPRNKLLRG